MRKTGKAKVAVSNRQREVRFAAARVQRAAAAAAEYAGFYPESLSVAVVGDRKMRTLNRRFAGAEGTTDVLAFDLAGDGPSDADQVAGEVVVNAHVAREEALKRGRRVLDELLLYVVHGVLHLSGMEDKSPVGKRRMRAAEKAVMRRLDARGGRSR